MGEFRTGRPCCGRCGRTSEERVMAYGPKGVRLCHANLDGTKSDPDCYHLVTVYGEPLTWLLREV